MHFKRASALIGALALSFIAAGCSGGGGGATPPLPVTPQTDIGVGNTADSSVGMGSGNLQTMSTTTNTEDSTITGALKTTELYGPIVALRTGGFQMHAQGGIGYVNVITTSSTHKFYNGLNPAVNEYAIVTATGSVATSPNPVMISLYKSQPGSVTVTGTITSEQTYGVAIKLDTNGSYIPVGFSSLTNLTGEIKTGVHISATGPGTSATLFPTAVKATSTTSTTTSTSSTPAPAPTTDATTASTSVPKHVMTATVFWGYGGTPTTVSATSAAPYLTWAQTGSSYFRTLQTYGIKVDAYVNFWRNYTSDYNQTLYKDIAPGGAHYPAAARTCTGSLIKDPSYGGGYETDARNSYALGHAKLTSGLNGANALFADDTGAMGGIPLPCNFSVSSYQTAVNTLEHNLGVPMFINSLGAGSSVVTQTGYATASNVLGAMCELCITRNVSTGDQAVLNNQWVDTENGEAKMVSMHKIFWLYARASGPYTEYQLRNYTIASFLLTYNPSYAMLQEVFQTGHKFPIFPETGLVPLNPVTTASTVSGYAKSNGTYMREFGACYYRGVLKGKCAVVVNPTSYSKSLPTTAYGHAMSLSGSGVLDGGTVSFSGGRPSSLPSGSGVVLFP